jgi:hypothetical protein
MHLYLDGRAKNIFKAIQASLGFLFVFGCTAFPPATEFRVRDSGLLAAYHIPIYWLNNDEVLFAGPTGETRRRPDGADEPVNRVSVWNIRTNEVRRYAEISSQLCHHEGYVVFWQRDVSDRRLWVNYGKLGKETRQERGTLQPGEFYDTHTCRHHTELPPLPEWTREVGGRRLLPQHGFLVNDRSFRNTPYRFCPVTAKDQEHCVELPIKRREVKGFTWYPFKRAYFAVGDYFQVLPNHRDGGLNQSPWPRSLPMPVWWLYPDGRVEQIRLPPGPWLDYFVFPTRVGMVTIGRASAQAGHTLYLVNGDTGIPLLTGMFEKEAVSPDGCQFAVIHDPKTPADSTPKYQRPITLKVIGLCQGEQDGIHRQ